MASTKPLVLITGSAGRLGSAIGAVLVERFTVVGFERDCRQAADCIDVDITSPDALAAACRTLRERHGAHIASVVHLAAYYDFSGQPDPKYDEVNVQGTRRLLEALQDFDVDQFVYASTMLVHAPTEPGVPIDENSDLAPKWPYPQSKLEAEEAVLATRGRIPAVILRIAGVYTDDCEVPSLAYQIQRIYERQMLGHVFPGDPAHGQAFVHLDDVAQAFRLVVEKRHGLEDETTLLIGEPVTESYESLQNLIGQLIHGEPWGTRRIPKPVAATGAWAQDVVEKVTPDAIDRGIEPFIQPFMVWLADDHYELDISRATELLGWRPQHSLRRVLPKMIGRLRQSPAAWYKANRIPLPLWLEDLAAQPQPEAQLLAEYDALDRREHRQTIWCHFANAALGLWLVSCPFIFGLADRWMEPGELIAPNERGLVLSDTWMTASDIVSGLLITAFALASLSRRIAWARWATAALGTWLLFAPLVFWSPSAVAYANDTLVGALVILFAVGVPSTPGVGPIARLAGPDTPPGWDYSPSSWNQRIPIIALALVGLFISRYLAAFQLGHIPAAWDPFFGDGTERIITSSVSEAWPVSDAGLGGAVYVLEIVTGIIGDKRRWRTLPWLVLLFGVLIVPLGAVSIFFIIIQPVVIGTWCTLCLVAAAAMLLQIPYSFDEILATLQFLKERRRQGKWLWHVLLHGDTIEGGSADYSDNFEERAPVVLREMLKGGVTVPWTLALSIVLGAVLMLSRLLFDTTGTAADNDHVVGALVITFSIMALAEVARPLRFINAAFGAWLLLAPWLLDGYTGLGTATVSIIGLLLVALALPRGAVESHYGAWDRYAKAGERWSRLATPGG
ncbi:SPW repeat domain-containing protein [Aromatoleum bremense]|uniref:NAD-dependent epimerase/dehydratase family protein n=1 Tax=Aromatoleum bremense TaxID=76115 RepID=A0ABX1NTJ6_9RHOO|nr:NAD-dependent epimerase/dehydratase family protein [Aromatoleum bremense]NMG15339.1 NAD-dependent epimerase/dehydratase family protein [Aromatoleum bremense]QTQ33161.1 NAD(P)-binding domain superfamily protein, Vitamin K epoxide reductase domain-containing [Aromatoleum bremense]